jgi:uncharacterized Zn finger protein
VTPESQNGTALGLLLSEKALRFMAGAACFDRGRGYAAENRVKRLKATGTKISCRVIGPTHYDVRIWAGEGDLGYSCTCPMGQEETFCKHCVAACLVWLGGQLVNPGATGPSAPQRTFDLRAFLLGCDKDLLVDLLTERAEADELFDAKLCMLAAKAVSAPVDLKPYRRVIERAIVVDHFVDYRSMYDYSSNVSVAGVGYRCVLTPNVGFCGRSVQGGLPAEPMPCSKRRI